MSKHCLLQGRLILLCRRLSLRVWVVYFEVIDLPISILTGEIIRCTKLFNNLPLKIGDCGFPSN